jgi:prepilin-type N-terminal cleavage/methylation domain-containing protein
MKRQGFTLIELSIALVIIGFIIGGILVGQDLIKAAATRATLAQVEKFNSAVNTFKTKYNGIPGDLINTAAASFGFIGANCNGSFQGWRDGNGVIDGWPSPAVLAQATGETGLFWQDLSTANMIDGTFPNGGAVSVGCGVTLILSSTQIGQYFPAAKLGNGNYFYVYEVNGQNWFGLSAVTAIASNAAPTGGATITVSQAYNMDTKVDDGLPTTGKVVAVYINGTTLATATANGQTSDSATSCYNSTTNSYSTGVNNGSGPNCALSFQMQGAAR